MSLKKHGDGTRGTYPTGQCSQISKDRPRVFQAEARLPAYTHTSCYTYTHYILAHTHPQTRRMCNYYTYHIIQPQSQPHFLCVTSPLSIAGVGIHFTTITSFTSRHWKSQFPLHYTNQNPSLKKREGHNDISHTA